MRSARSRRIAPWCSQTQRTTCATALIVAFFTINPLLAGERFSVSLPGWVGSLSFSPDGKYLVFVRVPEHLRWDGTFLPSEGVRTRPYPTLTCVVMRRRDSAFVGRRRRSPDRIPATSVVQGDRLRVAPGTPISDNIERASPDHADPSGTIGSMFEREVQ